MPLNITSSPAVRDCVKRHDKAATALAKGNSLASLTGSSANLNVPRPEAWTPPEGERRSNRVDSSASRMSADSRSTKIDEQIAELRSKGQKSSRQEHEDMLNLVIGGVILVNAIVIALETDLKPPDDEITSEDKVIWIVLESIFCIIFAVEIGIRVHWAGPRWFCHWANMFDAALVFVMMVETWILSFLSDDMEGVGMLAILRLVRVVRLVRLLRIVKLCRGFYAMACAFFHAAKSMGWLCLMMFTGLFLFSLFTTAFIGKSDDFKDVDMGGWTGYQRFGTVFRSMYSLFELMTLEGWPIVGRALVSRQPAMFLFLFIFIMVFTFGLLNMIVAMVVEATITQAKTMEELTEQEGNEKFADQLDSMRNVFVLSDRDGDGMVTLREFEQTFTNNEAAKTLLQVLQLPLDEATSLYQVLDWEERGEMSIEDFIDGISKIRGGHPTHWDIIATSAGVKTIKKQMNELRNMLKGLVLDDPNPPPPATDHPSNPSPPDGTSKGTKPAEGAEGEAGVAAKGPARTAGAGVGSNTIPAEVLQRLDAQSLMQTQILERLNQLAVGQADVTRRLDALAAGIDRGSAEPSAVTTHDGNTPRSEEIAV
mmetsp:Transcript_164300/g.299625  ORF Transcript_164300/g.299625 Transcript_164300/m.299625 type:complete len:596 (-) Transcript_164300:33-1820(-)